MEDSFTGAGESIDAGAKAVSDESRKLSGGVAAGKSAESPPSLVEPLRDLVGDVLGCIVFAGDVLGFLCFCFLGDGCRCGACLAGLPP